MPIIDTLLDKIGLIRKSHLENLPLAEGLISAGVSSFFATSPKKWQADRAFQLYNGWVYACVRAISEEIGNMELKLFRIVKDGEPEEIHEHELLDLLDGVNSFQTGFELKYITAAHLELAGNAYWLLEGVEKESDKPKAIYPLNPRFVTVKRATLPDFIKGYEYRVGAGVRDLEPYKVIHLKYPDPNDPYEGIGTVHSILQWIEADNFASQVNLKYFQNGARLAGLLTSETALTPEQLKFLKLSFEEIYRGAENAYKVAALPRGTDYKPLSDSPKDMDFFNLQQVMRDKILAGFRVPKTILGTAESETNRATAETANYVFSARTIKPKMQMIVSYLNEFLVPKFGDDLFLDFENPVPEDMDLRLRANQVALANKPYKSVNEVRGEEGLPPISNGDSVMTDFASVPLGKPQEGKSTKRKPRTNSKPSKRKTQYARSAEKRRELAGELAERIAESIKAAERAVKEAVKEKIKSITDLNDEEYEVIWKQFVSRVTPYERALIEAIRKFNANQKAKVLENLPKAVKNLKQINPADLFDKKEQIAALIDLSTPILTELFGEEAAAAAELLGLELTEPITPATRAALERSIRLMSRSYNETTLALLKEKLEQGIAEGASLDELEDLVSGVYEWSDTQRAAVVARTETFRTANDATHETWKQSGVVKSLKWFTAADERVCEFCAPLHGKIVGIDEVFFEKGEELRAGGRTLPLDYEDVADPPLHVSCRCYIRPEEISLE